jgi:hypothetical protein
MRTNSSLVPLLDTTIDRKRTMEVAVNENTLISKKGVASCEGAENKM